MAEVRDPIHGFIRFDELERRLIDSPPVQRLKYIHQLALGYLVYPGATHSRFEHALGTMELAGRAFDAICRNSPDLARSVFGGHEEQMRWRAVLRSAGLLHDIGHAPFSHAGDDLLGVGQSHEEIGRELIMEELATIFTNNGTFRLSPREVAYIATGRGTPENQAEQIAMEIITGDLGVDRMDYLRRDSYMCGVSYGAYDLLRLVDTLMLATFADQPALALELGGLNAGEGLLTARFFMFSQVYFHRVRDVYDGHLVRFLRENLPGGGEYPRDIREYLEWDDPRVVMLLREKRSHRDAQAILERKHFRMVHEFTPRELGHPDLPARVEDIFGHQGEGVLLRNSQKRAVVLQEGDVLIVDPISGAVDDILERSTTLSTFKGVWFLRVFSDSDSSTSVRNLVKGLLREFASEPAHADAAARNPSQGVPVEDLTNE